MRLFPIPLPTPSAPSTLWSKPGAAVKLPASNVATPSQGVPCQAFSACFGKPLAPGIAVHDGRVSARLTFYQSSRKL